MSDKKKFNKTEFINRADTGVFDSKTPGVVDEKLLIDAIRTELQNGAELSLVDIRRMIYLADRRTRKTSNQNLPSFVSEDTDVMIASVTRQMRLQMYAAEVKYKHGDDWKKFKGFKKELAELVLQRLYDGQLIDAMNYLMIAHYHKQTLGYHLKRATIKRIIEGTFPEWYQK